MAQSNFAYHKHYNVQNKLLNLNAEKLLSIFSEEKQRQLKKAKNNNIRCEAAQSIDEIECFYMLLAQFYKKEIRMPLFSLEFFVYLQSEKNAEILLVKDNSEIVGGIVLVHDHQTAYEWFVCGTKNNSNYPSVVATAAALQWAVNKGLNKFDFMGAGNDKEKQGVRNFKLRFGGDLVEHGRFLYIFSRLYFFGSIYYNIIKKCTKKEV